MTQTKSLDEPELVVPGYGTRMRIWEREGFRLELFDPGKPEYNTRQVTYKLLDEGKPIFGEPYCVCPPREWPIDCHSVVLAVLFWCTRGEHDVGTDYFNPYTVEQLTWRDSGRRERLYYLREHLDQMLREATNSDRSLEIGGKVKPSWGCDAWDGEDQHDLLQCETCYGNFIESVINRPS